MSQTRSCTLAFILQGIRCDDNQSQWTGPDRAGTSFHRGINQGFRETDHVFFFGDWRVAQRDSFRVWRGMSSHGLVVRRGVKRQRGLEAASPRLVAAARMLH